MRILNFLFWGLVLFFTIAGFYSCSNINSTLRSNEYYKYIHSDTTVCYFTELSISDQRVFAFLDSVILFYNNCNHCNMEPPTPEYFQIWVRENSYGKELYIMHSYWTEQISKDFEKIIGGFYYKEKLFLVSKNAEGIDNSLFQNTDCNIRIERCNLGIIGSCFTATFSLKNGKTIEHNCNDPFPFIK